MLGPLLCSCFLAICTNPLKVQREACTSATNTTLAVLSGTGLNEAADAAVERSLEVDARAPGGARGVAGVARCHPPVKTQFQ
jgi:hypothetical protein